MTQDLIKDLELKTEASVSNSTDRLRSKEEQNESRKWKNQPEKQSLEHFHIQLADD